MEDSKDYSWGYFTQSGVIAEGECDLIYAAVTPRKQDGECTLYRGTSANGTKIVEITFGNETLTEFSPRKPVHCYNGLYLLVGSNFSGVLIQWKYL